LLSCFAAKHSINHREDQAATRANRLSADPRNTVLLLEAGRASQFVYVDDGGFLTGSFADYAVPTASMIPELEILHMESPSPVTPLGAKGVSSSVWLSRGLFSTSRIGCSSMRRQPICLPNVNYEYS
jgi:hypothetical protein